MVLAHNIEEGHRSKDVLISKDVTFDMMLLSSNTLGGLKRSGFIRPSPIQLHGIPLGKCGFDLLLEAKSGTGKTAVFSVIALEKLDLDKGLQVVILAPTREIASQICDVLKEIGCQYNGLCVEVVMGGLPVQDDIEKFKRNKVHIVVGSPGRLKHLISDKHIEITGVRLLVLDEADKLMEKSFLKDIKFISLALPFRKQVIMSSATYPDSCKEFIEEFVQDAQHICPNSDCVLLGVVQKVTPINYNSNTVLQTRYRFEELLKIITRKQFKQCLIFCNYQVRVGDVHKMLTKEKWQSKMLYGSQEQTERLVALKTLQQYKCRILIATDLAARGIDASNVDLVINFEPPLEWPTYLHRIGRAGRYGSYGMAISIVSKGEEQKKFMELFSVLNPSIKSIPLWEEDEEMNNIETKISDEFHHSHINGSTNHDCSKLWNFICEVESCDNEEIPESFSELVNSFKNTTDRNTNEIESFSDLCNSFQNNSISDTIESKYKCIELPNFSTKHYLHEVKRETHSLYSKNCKQTKYEMESEIIENNITNNSSTKNYSISKVEDFSKSDFEYHRSAKIPVNALHQKNSDSRKQDIFRNSKKQMLCSAKIVKNRKSDLTQNIQSKESNTHMNTLNKLHKSATCNENRIFVQNSDPCSSRHHTSSKARSKGYATKEYPPTKAYSDWYNQLKLRFRHIELSLYIDELSKSYKPSL